MTPEEIDIIDRSLTREEERILEQLGTVTVKDPAAGIKSKRSDFGDDDDDDTYAYEVATLGENVALEQSLKVHLNDIRKTKEKIKPF